MDSTKAMRDRARELATPARDDFDRAVIHTLDDFDKMESELQRLRSLIEMEAGVPWSDGFITGNLKKIDAVLLTR